MKYLIALALMLVGTSSYADFVTLTVSGTQAFNTSLGTLNKVTVRFQGTDVTMGNAAAHSHTIEEGVEVELDDEDLTVASTDGVTFNPFNTTESGLHSHSFAIPTFSWNGKNIDLGSVNSSAAGQHSHTVSGLTFKLVSSNTYKVKSAVTTGSADTHAQTFSFDRSFDFTGTDLNLFLSGNPTAAFSLSFSVPGVSHSHQISAGDYTVGFETVGLLQSIVLSGSSGSHSVTLSDSNTNIFTTFEYTPFSAIPEPSSFVLFSVVAGAGAVGRRFWRKRKPA